MIAETIKETLRKYIHLCSWFLIKEGDQSVTVKEFEAVLNEIGKLEDKLRNEGISEKAIERVIAMTKENTNKPLSKMSEAQLLRVCKLIFGSEAEFAKEKTSVLEVLLKNAQIKTSLWKT